MTRIIICRHGSTLSLENHTIQEPHTPLSNLGKEQAHKLAARLKHERIELFLHSPLPRAAHTCTILHQHHPTAHIQAHPDLRERHYGTHHGKPRTQYLEAVKQSGLPRETYTPPGGENYQDVYQRANQAWQQVLTLSKQYQSIAIISHSVLISNLIATALDKPKETAQDYLKLYHTPTTISILEIKHGSAIPILLGDTSHLSKA